MHELSLAQGVLRCCAAHLGDPPGRIARVRLAVGELSAVEPDLLRFAWEAVTMGGPHEGARLDIDWHMARQRCEACDLAPERTAGAWSPSCPGCGQPLRVEGGQELEVLAMECIPASAGRWTPLAVDAPTPTGDSSSPASPPGVMSRDPHLASEV